MPPRLRERLIWVHYPLPVCPDWAYRPSRRDRKGVVYERCVWIGECKKWRASVSNGVDPQPHSKKRKRRKKNMRRKRKKKEKGRRAEEAGGASRVEEKREKGEAGTRRKRVNFRRHGEASRECMTVKSK